MSEKVIVTRSKLIALADTAREKAGTTDNYTLEGMNEVFQKCVDESSVYEELNNMWYGTGNMFTVKFLNYDGAVLYETSVEEGVTIVYAGETPIRPDDAQYKDYVLSSWVDDNGYVYDVETSITVTKNITLTAQFIGTLQTYNVYWYSEGNLLETDIVSYGETAEYNGETPVSSEGYVFAGWGTDDFVITGETYFYAMFVSPSLDAMTWSQISAISESGNAANYFAVGDCKAVTLNGTVGTVNYENEQLYAYILGFDHNAEIEGRGITFGTFKTAKTNGIDVCLIDTKYANSIIDGSKYFNISHWGYGNYGGWKACDMRYDILGSTDIAPLNYGSKPSSGRIGYDPSETCTSNPVPNTLMSALPEELRTVMKPMIKYSDNVGGGTNTPANVTTSIDYLPLLAEFEIFGTCSYANHTEQNYQVQYEYYKTGNSKIKYKNTDTKNSATWWERSAGCNSSYSFCYVNTYGNAYGSLTYDSCGVAPAFLI